jgi:hypothetical protein
LKLEEHRCKYYQIQYMSIFQYKSKRQMKQLNLVDMMLQVMDHLNYRRLMDLHHHHHYLQKEEYKHK